MSSEYADYSDIDNPKGLSEDTINLLLGSCEAMIHYACGDIFYPKDSVIKLSGDGSKYHFRATRPYLVSISKIEYVEYDSTLTLIDSSYYQLSDVFLITMVTGSWLHDRPYNYKVTCTVGHAEDDVLYKPDAIKQAIIALAVNILDEYYPETSGTSGNIIATPTWKFSSESITNYSYTLRNMTTINLKSDTPFGIPLIDNLIAPYRAKTLNIGVVSPGHHHDRSYQDMFIKTGIQS
jgi:hypothetical protein